MSATLVPRRMTGPRKRLRAASILMIVLFERIRG